MSMAGFAHRAGFSIWAVLLLALASSGQQVRQPIAAADPAHELRDALFDELARDEELYRRQLTLVRRVVKLVTPTVVHIDSRKSGRGGGDGGGSRFGNPQLIDEAGSGIVVRIDGRAYVLTNHHVVTGVSLHNLKIRTSGTEFLSASRVWSDPNTDVALIGVTDADLISARLGDSNDVEIGDYVLAMGSPFGLSHSVTLGIVSAKGRWDLDLASSDVHLQDFLQTDAAINPGNSGGPLLNLRGEVIGINTAIASNSGGNEGIGFSIPINLAMNVARQLVEQGTVSTAYLGVVLDSRFDHFLAGKYGLDKPGGALVKAVTPGSPAEIAQFEPGDIVVEFNGVHVQDDDHLVNLVSLTPLDQTVAVRVFRAGRTSTIYVRVGNRRDFE
jgi:serine protease Do